MIAKTYYPEKGAKVFVITDLACAFDSGGGRNGYGISPCSGKTAFLVAMIARSAGSAGL
jgi:hypothetical protein